MSPVVNLYSSSSRAETDLFDSIKHAVGDNSAVTIPSIAVIGNQSAGKSSVMERISGIILPRGDGMVTRCPLKMHLRNCTDSSTAYVKIYVEGHKNESVNIEKGETADYIDKLTDTIMEAADSEAKSFGFSCTPIHLEVGDVGLPDLTLIDLPGVYYIDTKTELEISGLKEYVHRMYIKSIQSPDCAIVCVMAATADYGAELARGWAKAVDPEGNRSIGVLTKFDMQEESVYDRLVGVGKNAAKFNLGVFGLFNLAKSLAEEKEFFLKLARKLNKPAINGDRYGLEAFISQLVKVQSERMRKAIPNLQRQIDTQLRDLQKEFDSLPAAVSTNAEALQIASGIFNDIGRIVSEVFSTNYFGEIVANNSLHFMPRTKEFGVAFIKELSESKTCNFSLEFAKKIRTEYVELRGRTLDDMAIHLVFDRIFIQEAELLKNPAFSYLEIVNTYFIQCLQSLVACLPAMKVNYPLLCDRVNDEIACIARKQNKICLASIKEKLNIEIGDHFTENGQYYEICSKLSEVNMVEMLKIQTNSSNEGDIVDFDEKFVTKSINAARIQKQNLENEEPILSTRA